MGMPAIPAGAFMDRNSLLTVTCPSSVEFVGSRAFFTCKSLISVTFAHGLIAVNSAAFYACRSLKYVSLPDTLALLGPGAFDVSSRAHSTAKDSPGPRRWQAHSQSAMAV